MPESTVNKSQRHFKIHLFLLPIVSFDGLGKGVSEHVPKGDDIAGLEESWVYKLEGLTHLIGQAQIPQRRVSSKVLLTAIICWAVLGTELRIVHIFD